MLINAYPQRLKTSANNVCEGTCGVMGSSQGVRNSLIFTPPHFLEGIITKSGAPHWPPDSFLRTKSPLRGFVRFFAYMFISK